MSLEHVIRAAINEHGAESGSNTPDYILARFMLDCLNAFNAATNERGRWATAHLTSTNKPRTNSILRKTGDNNGKSDGRISD